MALVIVDLATVKAHLRYPDPSAPHKDDAALERFISGADEVIGNECDDVLPASYSERHDGGDRSIFLRNLPVLSVLNVEESWGYIAYQLDYQDAGSPSPTSMFAYSLDAPETGQITRRTAGNVVIPFHPGSNNILVNYSAGYSPVPGNIVLAELELIAHWWQNSQLRAGGAGGASSDASYDAVEGANFRTEPAQYSVNYSVPNRIIELLKPHRHSPFIA